MEYRVLSETGVMLGQNQLEAHLEKIASDHNLKSRSDKNTYPIPRLKENFNFITEVYQLLNQHIKLKIPIHPAGEWILDNYYAIEETVKSIKSQLTIQKYIHFLGIANGNYAGFARIYILANEIINDSDSKINGKSLSQCLQAYQRKKTLNMEEIWNIPLFMQIVLIENIRQVAEKIYSAQLQKYKVENIIERLVEYKNKEELQFTHLGEYKAKVKGYGEMKYPFIEYLSYKLKKYGKKAYPYLNILEEQVAKMGMTIEEVVQKEHFDIAFRKISVGNAITSIKNLNRISMVEIFEQINGVEDILKKDPAGVYEKMDYQTKILYRNAIKELAQKTRISEIYIIKKVWNLAQHAKEEKVENTILEQKKSHVGYYLIGEGKEKLWEELTGKRKKNISNHTKIVIWSAFIFAVTILFSTALAAYFYHQVSSILLSIILGILLLIPIEVIVVQITQYILGKFIKPKPIPKLDFEKGIPVEASTFVVIPTILNSSEKVQKLMKKLESYYVANKSDNIYFALLGDCTSGKNKTEKWDEEVIKTGIKEAEELNKEYQSNFPRFHFLYRKRTWNSKEECYLGWERKRGLLTQFNEYILNKNANEFLANSIEQVRENLPIIKYVITLDADTNLCLNTGLELIGAMSHILNQPILNAKKDCVIQGHALLQPRVGISLLEVEKSVFTKIYAGAGGKDAYTNAISDIYQDNFEEGIYTGKGIYDVAIFSTVLNQEIPENTVLSHDLLEGSYLRCGLASDIMLMDGYPVGYNSFKARLHRWIRGDWQISPWLANTIINKKGERKKNPLNLLSKYKIFDNLVRSQTEAMIMLSLIYINIVDLFYNISIGPIVIVLLISALIPSILEILNRILFRKEEETPQKIFTPRMVGIKASILRGVLALASLPDKAYFSLNASIKTLYRMIVTKKHFLEWTTAEEAEKNAKKDVKSYYQNMLANSVIAILGFLLLTLLPQSRLQHIFIYIK